MLKKILLATVAASSLFAASSTFALEKIIINNKSHTSITSGTIVDRFEFGPIDVAASRTIGKDIAAKLAKTSGSITFRHGSVVEICHDIDFYGKVLTVNVIEFTNMGIHCQATRQN